jgi:hypothetical protein
MRLAALLTAVYCVLFAFALADAAVGGTLYPITVLAVAIPIGLAALVLATAPPAPLRNTRTLTRNTPNNRRNVK